MKNHEVLSIIIRALRLSDDARINDITCDDGPDHDHQQIIMTTDDGERKQVWVLDSEFILESNDEDQE